VTTPTNRLHSAGRGAAAVAVLLSMAACAPDAFRPEPAYDAFLNRVESACGSMRLGPVTIRDLIQSQGALGQQQGPYLLDVTSRWYNGRISEADYREAVAASFIVPSSDPAITCIVGQRVAR
jgi:hypothetical protein